MNNKVDLETRIRFRDWLREQLRELDFYQRRGNHYLIREFAKYCVAHGAPIDEASLGRYLRDEEPVLPTPERCRALARVLEMAPVKVLIQAGYLEGDDFFQSLPKDMPEQDVASEVRKRKAVVAQIAKRANDIDPLVTIVDQMQQSLAEIAGGVGVATGSPVSTKKPGSSMGPAGSALAELEHMHEAETSLTPGELTPSSVKESHKTGAASKKRDKVAGNR